MNICSIAGDGNCLIRALSQAVRPSAAFSLPFVHSQPHAARHKLSFWTSG